jgi:hypothetical protein
MWTMGDDMSPWSAFASYRPAAKTSYGPPQRHQQCGTSPGIFDTACCQVRHLTMLAIEPSRDTRLLIIASIVKGSLRPRLYISPASQPIPANAPPRDTRPSLIASNVKGPLDPGFTCRQQVNQCRPTRHPETRGFYYSPAMSKDHSVRGLACRQPLHPTIIH